MVEYTEFAQQNLNYQAQVYKNNINMQCGQNSCEGGLRCCVNIDYYPGFYCKIASQCYQQPLWQIITIPCMLAALTLALGLLIFCKLRGRKKSKRFVSSYVSEQIRVKPSPANIKHRTFTTVPETPNIRQNTPLITQNTIPLNSQLSSGIRSRPSINVNMV